jgi:hypothetical protein
MPIRVTCPSCHTRFQVADQHAGKTGACPKCKGPIEIPKPEDEVLIHTPELEAGAVDSKGRSVLKPISRKEAKFQPNVFLVVAGLSLLALAIAWLAGRSDLGEQLPWVLACGAILLGPPLAFAGYTFLRDDELGKFEGMNLALRSIVCGLVYALLWGVYIFVAGQLWGPEALDGSLEIIHVAGLGICIALVGAGTALVCFDFEYMTGFFHYALYFAATLLLRLVMGLPLMPGM